MGIKGKATVGGELVEVELEEVIDLDGHFTSEQVNHRIQSAVKERLKNHRTPEQLLEDEEHRKAVLEKMGIDPANPGKGKPSAEELQSLQESWRKRELEPEREARTKAEQRAEKVLTARKKSDLRAHLIEAGVKKQVAGRFAEMFASQFGYSEEHDTFGLVDGDGEFVFSSKPSKGKPFKDIAEFAAEFVADPENADWVETVKQGGPNLGGTRSTKAVTISRADARDHRKFKAAEKQAAEAGVELVVTD